MSERNTTVAAFVSSNTERARPNDTIEQKKNFKSDSTRIEDPEVLVEVPPTEVPFSAKPTHRVRIGTGKNMSVLDIATCLVDIGAGPNVIKDGVLKPTGSTLH